MISRFTNLGSESLSTSARVEVALPAGKLERVVWLPCVYTGNSMRCPASALISESFIIQNFTASMAVCITREPRTEIWLSNPQSKLVRSTNGKGRC